MRFWWLVTTCGCAWLVACGSGTHKKTLTCEASVCGPDEAAGAPAMEEAGGGPSAGGKDAGTDVEPDASLEAGAGGSPSEAGAGGSSSGESELRILIEGNGAVLVSGAATCLASPCSYSAEVGTAFTLQAKADSGSRFLGWSGDCVGSKLTSSVTLSAMTECTATFVVQRAVAAAVAGDGGGSVISDPDLNCDQHGCSGEVDNHSTVTFTATPSAGFGFVKWTGSADCEGKTKPSISIEVTKDLSCNATFGKQFKVAVSAAGASVQVAVQSGSCDALSCSVNADADASFHAALAPAGFRFSGWSGDAVCTGSANPLLVTHILGDVTCVANYTARFTATGVIGGGLPGTLTATSSEVAAQCTGASCTLDSGTSATLVGPNIPGYSLSGWTGTGCLGSQSGNGITVTPTKSNITCTANYTASPLFSVTGTVFGATGTVTAASTGGTCTPGKCNVTSGSSVTLTAPALTGYRFTGWSGDSGCSGASLALTLGGVTANKACNANYLRQFTIASVAGTGGTVTAKNGASACAGNSCTVDVDTAVALSAVATTSSGYHFTGWSGANCTSTASTLTLKNVNATCSASFALDTFTIAATAGTNGSVSATRFDTNAACAGATCTVNYGVTVSLAAIASANYHFNGWTGTGCNPTGSNPLSLTNITSNCSAAFAINTYAATVSAAPTAGGTVGIACTGNCGAVPYGQSVNVSAAANPGWAFAGWSANCGGGSATPKSVTITGPTACVASFRPIAVASTSPSGSGKITASGTPNAVCVNGDPANCVVDSGGSVTFAVTPGSNAVFTGWTGDCTGTNTTVTVTTPVTGPKNCTANFYNLWAQASGTKGDESMTHVSTLADGSVVGWGFGQPLGSKTQQLSLLTMAANTGKIARNLAFTAADGRAILAPLGLASNSTQKTPVALALHSGVKQPYLYTEKWDAEYEYSAGGATLDQGGEVISTLDGGYAFCVGVQDPPNGKGIPSVSAGHLTKLDPDGKPLWDALFCARDPKSLDCFPTQPVDVLQDPETKNYAVLSQVALSAKTIALTFISDQGEVLGSTFYGERTNLIGAQLVRGDKADTYLVVGSRTDANQAGNAFYAELGRAEGAPRFAFSLGATNDVARLLSVAKTATGYGLAGVYTNVAGKQAEQAWLVLIDNDGKITKQFEYGGPAAERANSISTVPAGGFVLGGATLSWGQGQREMWTVRVDATGAITFDTAVSPKPLFQAVDLTSSALKSITNPVLDTGSVKSTASQVKVNVTVKADSSFAQIKQTP